LATILLVLLLSLHRHGLLFSVAASRIEVDVVLGLFWTDMTAKRTETMATKTRHEFPLFLAAAHSAAVAVVVPGAAYWWI
jgi:hypothetical protein